MAKGLEKAIYLISDFVGKADIATRGIFYGQVKEGYDPKTATVIDKALAKGLIKVLKQISSVDFCNLTNYLIALTGGGGFNPNKRPDGGIGLDLWNIQNEAYKLQLIIDNNLGQITGKIGNDAVVNIADLLNIISDIINNKINNIIEEFILEVKGKESDDSSEYEKLNKSFKRLIALQIILQEISPVLETLGQNLTIASAQKAINRINKIRNTLVLIQGLSNPAAALTLVDSATGGAIQDQLREINNDIPIEKLLPLLKKCLKQAKNINSTGQKILGQIRTIQFIIKIAIVVIKVFTKIKQFFLVGFQLPNLYTTVSVTSKASNIVEEQITKKGIEKLVLRLEQINFVIGQIINFCTTLLVAVNEILQILRTIYLNIESCQNIDDELKRELSDTISGLTKTRDEVKKFLDAINSPINRPDTTFGGYTIEIVTEQVVDEAINLKRRYGIARGANNIIAVQSTPTFASLDLIIINEVKTLLVAKGLVKAEPQAIAAETLSTISESLKYLEDDSLSITDLEVTETPGEEPLGLQEFANNLPGGRALRKKVRDRLLKSNKKLVAELKQTDPSSPSTQKLIIQKEKETNKL